jgi:RHS repeat-associated protein
MKTSIYSLLSFGLILVFSFFIEANAQKASKSTFRVPSTGIQIETYPSCTYVMFLNDQYFPPSGYKWYWQTSSAGTSTAQNAVGSYTVYSEGYYYIREKNLNTGAWTNKGFYRATFSILSAGSIGGAKTICYNSSAGTLTDTSSPSGGREPYTYQWQKSSTGTGSWSTASGSSTGLTYLPGNLTSTLYFRRSVSADGCSNKFSNVVKITALPNLTPGSIGPNTSICKGNNTTISNLSSPSGGDGNLTYQWQISSSGTSNWTNISGATSLSYSVIGLNASKYYRRRVTSGSCGVKYTSNVLITVIPLPVQPVGIDTEGCAGNRTFAVVNDPNYDYVWYSAQSGGVVEGIGSSISKSIQATLTLYVAKYNEQTSNGCESNRTPVTATILIVDPINAGSIGGTKTICYNSSAGTLSNVTTSSGGRSNHTYQWQQSSTGTGSWSNATGSSTSLTYSPGVLTSTMFFRRNVSDGCNNTYSNNVKVTVLPNLVSGSIGSDNTICAGTSSSISSLSTASGGDSNLTYQWQSSRTGADQWTNISGATSLNYTTNYLTITTYFRRMVTSASCGVRYTSNVKITVFPLPASPVGIDTEGCVGNRTFAVVNDPDYDYVWYSDLSGGVVEGIGSSVVKNIQTNLTLYVAKYNEQISNGCESLRTPVTAIVRKVDNVTEGFGAKSFLSTIPSTLSISPVSNANDYNWYDDQGTLVTTGLEYSVVIDQTKSYFVKSVYNIDVNNKCENNTAKEVIQTLLETPIISLPGSYNRVNLDNPITLYADPSGFDQYRWYRNGVEMNSSPTYTITQAGTYTLTVWMNDKPTEKRTTEAVEIYSFVDYTHNNSSVIYVYKEGVKSLDDVINLNSNEHSKSVVYTDGLGRFSQSVAVAASPNGFDVVQPASYADFGRVEKQYLPFVSSVDTDGIYKVDGITQQAQFYSGLFNDSVVYNEVQYDDSNPYGIVKKQGSVGEDWKVTGAHAVTYDFHFNTDINIRYWEEEVTLSTSMYSIGTLNQSTITDAQNHVSHSFIDRYGRTVLKRQMLDGQSSDTYYLYDKLGRLTHIVPPLAVKVMADASNYNLSLVPELVYSFTYDNRSRVIERKVPGKGAEYIVYDKWNRALLAQNALLKAENKWKFIKYDKQHRPIMSGLYTDSLNVTRTDMQTLVNQLDYNNGDQYYEVRQALTAHGYSESQSFPQNNIEILSVNYYDDYDNDNDGTADYTYDASQLAGQKANAYDRTRGLPTAAKVKIVGTADWLSSVYFYDDEGHIIQTQQNNQQNSVLADINTAIYKWSGELLKTKAVHSGVETVTIQQRYMYDHAGRLKEVYHQIDADPEQLLSALTYNELGQVVEKNLHEQGSGFLQSVDLQYNMKGWLTSINDTGLIEENPNNGKDLFGMELKYNNASNAQYNGNIGAMVWSKVGDKNVSKYDFEYDDLGRLLSANHTNVNNGVSGGFNMNASYDLNGNILNLDRNNNGVAMDGLNYTYTNNQLMQVADSQSGEGFTDGNITGDDFTYDVNGNLIEDKNKNITSITYNYMDKPVEIVIGDSITIVNTYTALGSRITQQTYAVGGPAVKTDYVGAFLYENNSLQFIQTTEGRIIKDAFTDGWEYQYNLTDHLGNVRVMFTSKPKTFEFTLNYENDSTLQDDIDIFESTDNIIPNDLMDHTDAGSTWNKSQLLTGGDGSVIGSVLTIPVKPGDLVNAEVYAKYMQATTTNNPAAAIGAMVLTAITGNVGLTNYEGAVNYSYGSTGSIITNPAYDNTTSSTEPMAFINLMFLPQMAADSIAKSDFSYTQVSSASSGAHALLALEPYEVAQSGYIIIYLSNESSKLTEVYFDDIKVTVNQSNVIQANDYYPFGLRQSTSWTRATNLKNNRLFNGGSELNENTGNYETFYRNYDPALGRFNGVDIMAMSHHSESPYSFAGNDPIYYNDPMGDNYDPMGDYWGARVSDATRDGGGGGERGGSGNVGFWRGPTSFYGPNNTWQRGTNRIGPGSGNHYQEQGLDIYDISNLALNTVNGVAFITDIRQVPDLLALTSKGQGFINGIGTLSTALQRVGVGASIVSGVLSVRKYNSIDIPTWGDKTELGVGITSSTLSAIPQTTLLGIGIGLIDVAGGFDFLYDLMNVNENLYKNQNMLLLPSPTGVLSPVGF